MQFRRRVEKTDWTDHVRNEGDLPRVEEERNILRSIKKQKAKWIGHILCRNCFLNHTNEGQIEERKKVTGRRGRRRMPATA